MREQDNLNGDAPSAPQQIGTHPNWRAAVDQEVRSLGWESKVRIEQPHLGITIGVLDTVVEQDTTFYPEGPATFSLSIFLDGRGTLSVVGAKPLEISPGMAAVFSSKGYCKGENFLPGGQRLNTVDLRFERQLLLEAGGPTLAHLGGDLLTQHSLPEEGVCLVGFPASTSMLNAARSLASCKLDAGLARRLFFTAGRSNVSVLQSRLCNSCPRLPDRLSDPRTGVVFSKRAICSKRNSVRDGPLPAFREKWP